MKKITVMTEAGKVEVTSGEQALRIITSTSYSLGLTKVEDLSTIKAIRQLSDFFGIDLNRFKRVVVEDVGAHSQGFGPHILKYFPDSDPNLQVTPQMIMVNSNGTDIDDMLDILVSEGIIPLVHSVYHLPYNSSTSDVNSIISKIISHTNTFDCVVVTASDEDIFDFYKEVIELNCLKNYIDYGLITAVADEADEVIEVKNIKSIDTPFVNVPKSVDRDIQASSLYE